MLFKPSLAFRSSLATIATLAATVLFGTANAVPHIEVGDAGQLLSTSQGVGAGVNSIVGNLGATDVDMYKLHLPGGLFTAATHTVPCCPSSVPDTQLFLFDSTGLGIVANDDAPTGTTQGSFIQTFLVPGAYYLAVSVFDMDPQSAGGPIFPNLTTCCDHPISGPTGPGGAQPLAGWVQASPGAGQGGAYTIALNQTTTVPEPTTLALLGVAVAGLGFSRRRKLR